MTFLNNLIVESAQRWGITARQAKWLFWLPILATGGVMALGLFRDVFRALLSEDGPIEWLTVLAFAVSAIVAMRIAVQRMSANRYWQALLFIVVALAMIYAAGEEISWGQRIFGFATPEELAAINDQSETTLHNIRELLDLSNLALLLMGLYGSIAYLINRRIRIERYWDKAEYLFVPPFFLIMFFVPIFVFRVLRFFLITESSFALNRISEWNEAVIAFGILIFLWLACTRVISASSSQAASRVPQNRAETK